MGEGRRPRGLDGVHGTAAVRNGHKKYRPGRPPVEASRREASKDVERHVAIAIIESHPFTWPYLYSRPAADRFSLERSDQLQSNEIRIGPAPSSSCPIRTVANNLHRESRGDGHRINGNRRPVSPPCLERDNVLFAPATICCECYRRQRVLLHRPDRRRRLVLSSKVLATRRFMDATIEDSVGEGRAGSRAANASSHRRRHPSSCRTDAHAAEVLGRVKASLAPLAAARP